MAFNNIIDRAGAQALQPEQGRSYHEKRHPQTGRFIEKARAPVKAPVPPSKRKRPSLPAKGD